MLDQISFYKASNNLTNFDNCYVDGRIVHYSSLGSFYKIIESELLRFTSAGSLNDPSEWNYGMDVVKKAYSKSLPHWNEKESEYWSSMVNLDGSPIIKEKRRVFVFCCSQLQVADLNNGELSQWRLYGDDGRGLHCQ